MRMMAACWKRRSYLDDGHRSLKAYLRAIGDWTNDDTDALVRHLQAPEQRQLSSTR
jgi:hypothetical protein